MFIVEAKGDRADVQSGDAFQNPSTMEVYFDATVEVDGDYIWAVRAEPRRTVIGKGELHITYAAKIGEPVSSPAECSRTGTKTIVVNDSNGIPISCVCISVTSDSAGANLIASGKTDSLGKFYFDSEIPATKIYVWRSKKGYRLINPVCVEIQNNQGEE